MGVMEIVCGVVYSCNSGSYDYSGVCLLCDVIQKLDAGQLKGEQEKGTSTQ